jgi:hypothetical protein
MSRMLRGVLVVVAFIASGCESTQVPPPRSDAVNVQNTTQTNRATGKAVGKNRQVRGFTVPQG